jgi:hypothetical protein
MDACAYCKGPLPPKGSRGPAPDYCSQSCRQAAYRARRRRSARLESAGLPQPAQTIPRLTPADADSQVARAILEARSVAGAFVRLGREARVELAWRCGKTGEAMLDAMDRYFPEVR